jgi:hypothetical protein
VIFKGNFSSGTVSIIIAGYLEFRDWTMLAEGWASMQFHVLLYPIEVYRWVTDCFIRLLKDSLNMLHDGPDPWSVAPLAPLTFPEFPNGNAMH